jgi:Domain of Unknown Function with PDB structure (DUF3857)
MDDRIATGDNADIAPRVTRAPTPPWVDLAPYPRPAQPNPNFLSGGVCYLLDDTQVDLTGAERAWFFRRADLVVSGAGVERAAQFEAVFDPACEKLEIHFVRVLRGDKTIDHTQSPNFEVMRRERNLEQLKFDGRLSAHLSIPDVRAGDVVEFAYTIHGMRPILCGRHAATVVFEWQAGIVEVRHRLRAPAGRVIAARGVRGAPEETRVEADGVVDRRWRGYERDSIKIEPLAPPWIPQCAEIQFSEWRDWREVAEAFAPVYVEDGALPEEIEAEIARIAQAFPEPAARAAAALAFVQDSVRYLAISMGNGGFVPRPIADIWATRYGDCKDAAKLYVAVATRLGLDACPALVNTYEGLALGDWLPTAYAFNHCVVRVRIGAATHWLDPTSLVQPSKLEHLAQPRFGFALPLAPDASALEDMGEEPFLHTLECEERIALGESPETPVQYEWRITQRGWRAEQLRGRIEREGELGLFRSYADSVTRVWPKAKVLRQEIVLDDRGQNVLATLESYSIEEAWAKSAETRMGFSTLDLVMRSQLAKLDPGPRAFPIDLGHIGKLTRRVEIATAIPWRNNPFHKRVEGSVLAIESQFKQLTQQLFELSQTLEIKAWTLPAGEAQVYRDVVAELELSDVRFEDDVAQGKFKGPLKPAESGDWWWWLRIAILAAAAIAWALYNQRG